MLFNLHVFECLGVLLNNEWVKNEIREEIKKLLEANENELTTIQNLRGNSKGSPEREVHSNTGIPKKNRNISKNNLTLHLQELKEQQQRQPRASTRKEIATIKQN